MTYLAGMEMALWMFRFLVVVVLLTSLALGVNAIVYREFDVSKPKIEQAFDYAIRCLKENKEISIPTENINWKIELYDLENNNTLKELFKEKQKFRADYPLCYIKYANKRIKCFEKWFYLLKDDKPYNVKIIFILEK